MALLYITCRDKKEAERISRRLLEKKLVGCANMFPISSMYRWNKKIVNDAEYAIMAKTSSKNFRKAEAEIKKMHSYKIQCILRIGAKANKEYDKWLHKQID